MIICRWPAMVKSSAVPSNSCHGYPIARWEVPGFKAAAIMLAAKIFLAIEQQ